MKYGRHQDDDTHVMHATVAPGRLDADTQWDRAGRTLHEYGRHRSVDAHEYAATVAPGHEMNDAQWRAAGRTFLAS
jgi:hypothetical protein